MMTELQQSKLAVGLTQELTRLKSEIEMATDITASRHGGNEESRSAHLNIRLHKKELREQVLNLITAFTPAGGITMKEVASIMGVEINRVSGRGSELKRLGMVRKSGEIRDGSAVLVLAKEWVKV